MQNKSSELLRNGKVRVGRSAWEIPVKTITQQLQRDLSGQHKPAKSSYFHITPAGSHHRSQRISKAAI